MIAKNVTWIPAVLLLATVSSLSSQSLVPGDRVRVRWVESTVDPGDLTVDRRWVSVVGTFQGVRGDTMHIADENGTAQAIPIESLQQLDGEIGRSTGTRRWRIAFGLVGWALAGALSGDAWGDDPFFCSVACEGAILGGLVGTIVGGALSGEKWDTVPLGGVQPTVSFIPDGRFALSVNVKLR